MQQKNSRTPEIICFVLFFLFVLFSSEAFCGLNSKYAPEIKAALSRYVEYYKNRDARGIASLYLSEENVVAIGAGKDQKETNRAGIRKAYEEEFSFYREIRSLQYKVISMSSLGHICWISAEVHGNAFLAAGAGSMISGRLTAVLRRIGAKWYFVQTHFSLPADGPKIIQTERRSP
ncbi:MAG TPA: nuclear transport factor 2 family protein [Syntrophales bacterium]|nr:nuclear transport factor 2 family protein [Syntrophales bacterium]